MADEKPEFFEPVSYTTVRVHPATKTASLYFVRPRGDQLTVSIPVRQLSRM